MTPLEHPIEQHLLSELNRLFQQLTPPVRRVWVGYSGGVDSHVLLYALSRIGQRLNNIAILAVHIDHQLSPLSSRWSDHCSQVCRQLHVSCEIKVVDAKAKNGQSPEAAARVARYRAFVDLLESGDCLLAAHHQDDQAETLLLQLLRGGGPRGLAAMPRVTVLGNGSLIRPLLDISREQIVQYAREQQLHWIDDISNTDPTFDRNFLRLQVIPLLKQRWPAMAKTVSRSAQLCADTIAIIDAVASDDLLHVREGSAERMSLVRLQSLDLERQHNVVRAWLESLGLPCPSQKTLHHIWSQVIDADPHANPCLQWPGAEIRRYREHLFAMSAMAPFDHRQRVPWSLKESIMIQGVGCLKTLPVRGRGLAKARLDNVSIRFRQGGERCKLPKRGGEHSLKNLFQELGIVPWMRERVPLIYTDDTLAAVGDLLICEGLFAAEDEEGIQIVCDYEHPVR